MVGVIYICQSCGKHFMLWSSIDSHECRGIYAKDSTLVYILTPYEDMSRPYYGIYVELVAYHH